MRHLHRSFFFLSLLTCLLPGCGYQQLAGSIAAAGGYAGSISDETIDKEPRPPKQVVFRFDEHRYIENDPSGGYVGGCQGELYYVDEKLGIRTWYGGNKKENPRGAFKVDSPYVVVRDQSLTYVSFDQGRTFVGMDLSGQGDISVVGATIYQGGGGRGAPGGEAHYVFSSGGILVGHINEVTRSVDIVVDTPSLYATEEERGKIAAPYLATAKATQPKQMFVCKDLPWRPSAKRERELLKQQQSVQP